MSVVTISAYTISTVEQVKSVQGSIQTDVPRNNRSKSFEFVLAADLYLQPSPPFAIGLMVIYNISAYDLSTCTVNLLNLT